LIVFSLDDFAKMLTGIPYASNISSRTMALTSLNAPFTLQCNQVNHITFFTKVLVTSRMAIIRIIEPSGISAFVFNTSGYTRLFS
jgi:hypothetical protein